MTAKITAGSPNVKVNGIPVSRLNDTTNGVTESDAASIAGGIVSSTLGSMPSPISWPDGSSIDAANGLLSVSNPLVLSGPPTSNNEAATKQYVDEATGAAITYPIAVNKGGTGANTANAARTNLGLATVANTGSFNDLLNKPTIPAAQVQSDWNEANTTAVDYIKNKPTIPTTLPPSGNAGGVLSGTYPNPGLTLPITVANGVSIVETATGSNLSINAAGVVEIRSNDASHNAFNVWKTNVSNSVPMFEIGADGSVTFNGQTSFSNAVTLAANPTANLQAATKQYVDSQIGGGTTPTGTAGGDLSGTYPNPSVSYYAGSRLGHPSFNNVSEGCPIITPGSWTVVGGGPCATGTGYITANTNLLPLSFTMDLGQNQIIQQAVFCSNWPGDNRSLPSAGTIDGSTDNSTWTTGIGSWSNISSDPVTVNFGGATGYRYLRFNITGAPLNPGTSTVTSISKLRILCNAPLGGGVPTQIITPAGMSSNVIVACTGNSVGGGAYLNVGPGGGTITIGSAQAAAISFAVANSSGIQTTWDSGSIIHNGNVTSKGIIFCAPTGYGSVSLSYGSTATSGNNTGYVGFYDPSGTRHGYIGYSGSNNMSFAVDQPGAVAQFNMGASFANAIYFGSVASSTPTDLSHHINLWGSNLYGFSVTGSTLNIVVGGASVFSANTVGDFTIPRNTIAGGNVSAVGVSINGDWYRASGQMGLYFQTYGSGWHMQDSTYVRTYNGGNHACMASDFVLSSDAKLKDDIVDLEYHGRLRPRSFRWKANNHIDIGFIAQEVEDMYPEVIGHAKDADGKTETKVLSYSKLTTILSKQINDLEDVVKQQSIKIECLQQELLDLKQHLEKYL